MQKIGAMPRDFKIYLKIVFVVTQTGAKAQMAKKNPRARPRGFKTKCSAAQTGV